MPFLHKLLLPRFAKDSTSSTVQTLIRVWAKLQFHIGSVNILYGISRAVGEEKEDGKKRRRRKKMEVKSVARRGRGDGSKRGKERDGISRVVREEKEEGKKEE